MGLGVELKSPELATVPLPTVKPCLTLRQCSSVAQCLCVAQVGLILPLLPPHPSTGIAGIQPYPSMHTHMRLTVDSTSPGPSQRRWLAPESSCHRGLQSTGSSNLTWPSLGLFYLFLFFLFSHSDLSVGRNVPVMLVLFAVMTGEGCCLSHDFGCWGWKRWRWLLF